MSNFREVVEFRSFLEIRKNFKLLEHKDIIYHFEAVEFRSFLEIRNNFKLLEHKDIIYHFEAGDLDISNI